MNLVPIGSTHNGNSIWYQTAVNVQAFTSTFTFVPSGYDNFAFVIQNEDNNGNKFTYGGGAGPEGGFSQFSAGGNIYTTNVFALDFDQWSTLTNSGSLPIAQRRYTRHCNRRTTHKHLDSGYLECTQRTRSALHPFR